MTEFALLEHKPGTLLVIRAVVRDPGLTENLPPETTGKVRLVLPVPLQELRVGSLDLKRMRRRAKAHDRSTASQIVGDLLHLVVGKILEPQEDDEKIGRLERVEPRDVRTARLDEPGLRISGEEDAALKTVMLRQNAR